MENMGGGVYGEEMLDTGDDFIKPKVSAIL